MEKVSNRYPLISVIVPVYNTEKYLEKCLMSLIEQTYPNIELVVINDGSTDASGKICEKYKKKYNNIKYEYQENNGVSSARNKALKKCDGEYITFVDSDDWVEIDYCEKLYNSINKNDSEIVICGFNKIYDNQKEKCSFSKNSEYSSAMYTKYILNPQTGFGMVAPKLIKKEIIENTFNTNLKIGEDALFMLQLAKNVKKVTYIDECLYNYRINADSAVRKYNSNYVETIHESMNEMYKFVCEMDENQTKEGNIYNYITYHLFLIIINYCCHPQNSNSLKSIKEVCRIPLFKQSIDKSTYENLSISRKVFLFLLKRKMYLFLLIAGKIRQNQLK